MINPTVRAAHLQVENSLWHKFLKFKKKKMKTQFREKGLQNLGVNF